MLYGAPYLLRPQPGALEQRIDLACRGGTPTWTTRRNTLRLWERSHVLRIWVAGAFFMWIHGRGPQGICLSLIHISEPTRLRRISYAVFCLKKKKRKKKTKDENNTKNKNTKNHKKKKKTK